MTAPDLSPEAVERLAGMAWIEAQEMPRTHVRDVFRDCAATLRALSAEVQRLREALYPFADFADFMDSETSGFCDQDEIDLMVDDHVLVRLALHQFKIARAALPPRDAEGGT